MSCLQYHQRGGLSSSFLVGATVLESNMFLLYIFEESSCLHRASIVLKTLFIFPTDANYYQVIEMLKQFKIIILVSDMFRFTQEPSSGSIKLSMLCLQYHQRGGLSSSFLVGATALESNMFLLHIFEESSCLHRASSFSSSYSSTAL